MDSSALSLLHCPNCHSLASIRISFFYFILITSALICSATATRNLAKKSEINTSEFITNSCGTTLYTKLCIETLSPYSNSIQTNPKELANAALTVSLKGAKSTTNKISKMSKEQDLGPAETHALTDCVENMEDSVDELQKSLLEMKNLNGPDFEEKMGNVMTWVSAALTDEDTCMDGFDGNGNMNEKVKATIRNYIVNVAQLTSNALALTKNLSSS
ncbi:21 kDa protein-like [Nicotiana tabacum]|uniref:21 kDa protein-like n=1 Tax=Nicotiana tabacum TaxID=4097 RepID=A0A1S4D554_TOBAC|nr:PREDICTED: 21 kDa protein-like [Nicotiana tabacum]